MNKSILFIGIILLCLLSACATQVPKPEKTGFPSSTPSPETTFTKTRAATLTPRPTATRKPSWTPFRTYTPSLTPTPTLYPTFVVSEIKTHTPQVPARCPLEDPDMHITIDPANMEGYINIRKVVQSALEQGASFQQIWDEFEQYEYGLLKMLDLTGDGVDELIVYGFYVTDIYGCEEGKHRLLMKNEGGTMDSPHIIDVLDMNLNGTPDVVFLHHETNAWNAVVNILEWDGQQFIALIESSYGKGSDINYRPARILYWYEYYSEISLTDNNLMEMNGPGKIKIADLDGNGTQELIVTDHSPCHFDAYYSFGPWRGRQLTYTWNGVRFMYSDLKMDPPEYRFQAVQDADRYFLLGRYDEALALYKQAIYNDQLEWWTQERMDYILKMKTRWMAEDFSDPEPEPNPDEYAHLAAYSRYRILLHHVARGWLADAKVVYDTLQRYFPAGAAGHEFAEMATLFWEEYNRSGDMASACAPVVAYAGEIPGLFDDLGNVGTRSQSHRYIPEDICPFP